MKQSSFADHIKKVPAINSLANAMFGQSTSEEGKESDPWTEKDIMWRDRLRKETFELEKQIRELKSKLKELEGSNQEELWEEVKRLILDSNYIIPESKFTLIRKIE